MRITATLLLLSAIGCGGAGEKTEETTQAANAPAMPAAEAPASEPAPADPAPAQDPAATPAAATPAPPPAPTIARAELRLVSGDKPIGTMTFEQSGAGINITGEFTGLKKGTRALYIHEVGDCSNKGKKVGGHLDPTKQKHGPPASPQRHAGDFGDITVDKDGNATFTMTTDSITLEQGRADSIVGRSVVIHTGKDNKKGSAGGVLACGVVMLDGATDGATPAAASGGAAPPTVTPTSAQ